MFVMYDVRPSCEIPDGVTAGQDAHFEQVTSVEMIANAESNRRRSSYPPVEFSRPPSLRSDPAYMCACHPANPSGLGALDLRGHAPGRALECYRSEAP